MDNQSSPLSTGSFGRVGAGREDLSGETPGEGAATPGKGRGVGDRRCRKRGPAGRKTARGRVLGPERPAAEALERMGWGPTKVWELGHAGLCRP